MKRHLITARTFSAIVLAFITTAAVNGQRPVHYRYRTDMPPGAIGARLTQQNLPFRGYVQPVDLQVPAGAEISIASDGAFQYPSEGSLQVGLNVGNVYRLKVTNIPRHDRGEIYPSVEIINRLYPPSGQKWRFPIPIQIAQEDLEQALAGKMVIRVVYVENPNEAFPESDDPNYQRYFDVLPDEDPLQVADELGRPIAIVRLGSRKPSVAGTDHQFLFNSPPVSLMSGSADQSKQIEVKPFTHTPDGKELRLRPVPEPETIETPLELDVPAEPDADPFMDDNS